MMSRIKDYLLRQQNNQDQPNPKEIKLFDIFFLASTKGSSIKFSKIIANTRK